MKKTSAFLAALAIVLSVSAVSCGNDPVGTASDDNIVLEIPSGTEEASEEASESTTTAASSAKSKDTTTAASTSEEDEDTTETKTEAATETETEAATEAPKATEAPRATEAPAPAPTEAPEQPQVPAQSSVSMNYDTLLSNASGLISSLGTPTYEGGGAACTQGGYDVKVYRFDGVEVQAYIDGGAEYVFDVKVTSGDYSVNGVRIGMTKAEAEALLGTGEAAGSMYIYMNGNKETDVTYSGDVVTEIELYTAV